MDIDRQEYELQLEYGLTMGLLEAAVFDGEPCACVQYLKNRKSVLLPEILKKSKETGEDAADIFHRFRKGLHARHEEAS